jgi:hypothetical protein
MNSQSISRGHGSPGTTLIGLGLGIYAESNSNPIFLSHYEDTPHMAFSFNGGILFRSPDESVIFDTQAGYGTGKIGLINPDTISKDKDVGMPLFIESTLTLALTRSIPLSS